MCITSIHTKAGDTCSFPHSFQLFCCFLWYCFHQASNLQGLCFLIALLTLVESPRWLLKKSGVIDCAKDHEYSAARVRDALKSLIQLHDEPTHILAAGELYLLYRLLLDEQAQLGTDTAETATPVQQPAHRRATTQENGQELDVLTPRNAQTGTFRPNDDVSTEDYPLVCPISYVSWGTRWKLMFGDHKIRRANYAAAAVMIAQQLCGINLLAFLADTFFRNSFFDTREDTEPDVQQNTQLLAFSFGFGFLNFV